MEPINAESILKFLKTQKQPHKYEANIFPSSSTDDNEYYSIVEFTKKDLVSFLIMVKREISQFPLEDKPYAIVFMPDSDEALFKIHGSTIYDYIIEDLTKW